MKAKLSIKPDCDVKAGAGIEPAISATGAKANLVGNFLFSVSVLSFQM